MLILNLELRFVKFLDNILILIFCFLDYKKKRMDQPWY